MSAKKPYVSRIRNTYLRRLALVPALVLLSPTILLIRVLFVAVDLLISLVEAIRDMGSYLPGFWADQALLFRQARLAWAKGDRADPR